MNKFLYICLMVGLSSGCLSAAEAIYLKVKPGQSISQFNKSGLTNVKLKVQKLNKEKSSFGVQSLPTAVQNQFFNLNDENWKGGMVQYQNNEIQKVTFFNEKVPQDVSGIIFKELERSFGPDFTIHPFKSFGKEGISFSWVLGPDNFELSVVNNKRNNWIYRLEVKKADDLVSSRPTLNINNPEVIALVGPILQLNGQSSNAGQFAASNDLDNLFK